MSVWLLDTWLSLEKKDLSIAGRPLASLSSACCLGFELSPLCSPGNAPCPAGQIKMPSSARVLQLPFVFRGSSPSHQKGQELEQVRVEMGLRDFKDLSPKAFPRKDFLLVLPTFFLKKAPAQTYAVSGNGTS